MSDLWRRYAPTLHNKAVPRPEPEEAAAQHDGVMVALYPDADVASAIAVPGGEPAEDIHLTLAFLGKGSELIGHEEQLRQIVESFSRIHDPLTGEIAGIGLFTSGPIVSLALPDLPGLPEFRQDLVGILDAAGFPVSRNHGFTPHMTLAYRGLEGHRVPNLPLTFSKISVVIGMVRTDYPLGKSLEEQADAEINKPTDVATASVVERVPETKPEEEDVERAFVSELNGKTLITGPASTFANAEWAQAARNPYNLRMVGRFVGAEKPNRNNAFWETADLAMGQPTVANGPLNWLHEAKHVIGTLTHSRLVTRDEQMDLDLEEPHIQAAATIWRWIYPDEASVVEMASDAGRLWYSMECVSETVQCIGEQGCGREVGYMDMLRGQGCQHMIERSSVRHFKNPTFLGGAVIVPPARPGWASADAMIMQQASQMAEKAFEQAQPKQFTASEWEQMMAQVLIAAQ